MSTEVIREFLVSLGYKVDTTGQRRFVDGVEGATKAVAALGAAATAAAGTALASIAKMASGLEDLYYMSQRTRASAENILAVGFAAGQMGSSVEGARQSLESLARFIRENPGGEGLIGSLGVATRDANGQLRDTSRIMEDIGSRLARMPYYRARQYGNLFGFDEKTLMALRQGLGGAEAQYRQMLRAAGLDADAAAKSSHDFMNSMREVVAWIRILWMKVTSDLAGGVGNQIQRFREKFVANFDRIASVIASVIKAALWLADILTQIAMRAIDAVNWIIQRFEGLDEGTQDLIKTIGLLVAAWWAFNKVISLSPVGIVLALAAAIVALWDDYRTWKEGGKSLIDWGKWEPGIKAATEGIKTLIQWLKDLIGWTEKAFEKMKEISDKALGGTKAGDKIGDLTARAAAFFGNREAQEAVWRAEHGGMSPKQWVIRKNYPNGNAPKALLDKSEEEFWKEAGIGGGSPSNATQDRSTNPGDPLGIRNNNPGNLRTGPGGSFGVYATAQEGLNALSRQLGLYYNGESAAAGHRKLQNVRDIISTYAPKNENNTAAYIAAVSGALGVSPDAQLDLNDVATKAKLMQAITLHENGVNPYTDAMFRQAAGAGLNQTTNITVYGSDRPQETANEIAARQNQVNDRATRNLKAGTAT